MKIKHVTWKNPEYIVVGYYPSLKAINHHNVFKEDLDNPAFNHEYIVGRWNIKYKNQ